MNFLVKTTFFLLLMLLSSCGRGEPKVLTLSTSSPSLVPIVEEFNRENHGFHLLVDYSASPAQTYLQGDSRPDLFIAPYLFDQRIIDRVIGLESVLPPKESFIPKLLDAGVFYGRQRLIPLSFDPMILVLPTHSSLLTEKTFITFGELQEGMKSMNRYRGGNLIAQGFNPLWSDDFLQLILQSQGSELIFRGRVLDFHSQGLHSSIKNLKTWIESAGGLTPSQIFQDKYFLGSPFKLLVEGRIGAFPSRLSIFLSLPEELRAQLQFRFLSPAEGIYLPENTLWAAIPNNSRYPGEARFFLRWLLDQNNQSRFLPLENPPQLQGLGFLSGLPATWEREKKLYIETNPELYGPLENTAFRIPTFSGGRWRQIFSQVFIPWLRAQIQGEEVLPLEDLTSLWVDQHGSQ